MRAIAEGSAHSDDNRPGQQISDAMQQRRNAAAPGRLDLRSINSCEAQPLAGSLRLFLAAPHPIGGVKFWLITERSEKAKVMRAFATASAGAMHNSQIRLTAVLGVVFMSEVGVRDGNYMVINFYVRWVRFCV